MLNLVFYKNLEVLRDTNNLKSLYYNNFELFKNDIFKYKVCTCDDLNKIIYYTFNEAINYLKYSTSIYNIHNKNKLERLISESLDNVYYIYTSNNYINEPLIDILCNIDEHINIIKNSKSSFLYRSLVRLTYPIYSLITDYNHLFNPYNITPNTFKYILLNNPYSNLYTWVYFDTESEAEPEVEDEPDEPEAEAEDEAEPEEPEAEPEPEEPEEPDDEPEEPEAEPEPEEPEAEPEAEAEPESIFDGFTYLKLYK